MTNGARPSAQGARRPRRPAFYTAAETRNGAASLRATGAGGAIGHGRTRARARAVAHIHPLKAVRCANRAAWQGVRGSGNNMPRGGPPVCAAGAARWRPVMPRIATGAPGARPNAQEKWRKMQGADSVIPGGAPGGFASIVPHLPGRVPVSSVRPPALGAFGRAPRAAGSATPSYCHQDRHRQESWDMGSVGRCSGLPGLRQAFPGPGGAYPGYVEHRPVSGAGVRKLVAARCARFREFAPLRLARLTGTNRPNRHIWEMRRDVSRAFRRLHICVPGNTDPA